MMPTDEGRGELKPELRPAPEPIAKKLQSFTAAPLRRQGAEAIEEKKKGVEIEGPLADRRVVSYEVPEFPEWARQQGILEATVAIRFYVSPEGDVLPNMRIERTSGYGRMDRLAMDSLKLWKFAPLGSDQRQWGIITFRFLLE
jgi:TonB family protein